MIPRHRFVPLLIALAACGQEARKLDGQPVAGPDSMAAMGDMPGMVMDPPAPDGPKPPPGELSLTAAQIERGGVAWAPVAGRSVGLLGAPLPGQLVPNEDRTARLGAPGEGRVMAVLANPGDRVRAGQPLVTMQSPAAGMAQADLAKAVASLTASRAQAVYARSARERAERLLALKAIPRQEFERAVADDAAATSMLTQAEAEVQRARSTAASLGASDSTPGALVVRAPFAGVILDRIALPGAVVDAGAALMIVTDPASLWLTVSAPEALTGSLRVGGLLRFTVPAYPADTFAARLTAVGAGLDPETRTLQARGVVSNPSGRLKSAMLATVYLQYPEPSGRGTSNAIVLPADAVQTVGEKPSVFVAIPDAKGGARFIARPVVVTARSGNQVSIGAGVSVGDLIVVRGAFSLKAALTAGVMPKMEM